MYNVSVDSQNAEPASTMDIDVDCHFLTIQKCQLQKALCCFVQDNSHILVGSKINIRIKTNVYCKIIIKNSPSFYL